MDMRTGRPDKITASRWIAAVDPEAEIISSRVDPTERN
jgi:hypothetical protein